MGDTATGSWTSRELGQYVAQQKDEESRKRKHRELVYEFLLKVFQVFVDQLGGWQSESGVYLDGKLWALAEKIVNGELELAK